MFPLKCGPVVGLSALTGGSEEVHVVAVFMERAVVLSCLCVCVFWVCRRGICTKSNEKHLAWRVAGRLAPCLHLWQLFLKPQVG